MSKIKNIIFDFGGVLIDWNPVYLYSKIFENKSEMNYFLENICTLEWHVQQDKGRLLSEATETLQEKHPEYKELIGDYYGRWEEMFGKVFEESVRLIETLKPKYPLYGLTNWSAETFPITYNRFDFFKCFDGIVVSGDEKLIKPNPKLYQIILDRYNLKAEESLFIDDNIQNIESAQKIGFQTIHFTKDTDLEKEMKAIGVL